MRNYDVSINPIFAVICLRQLSLNAFKVPDDISFITEGVIKNYTSKLYTPAAQHLIKDFSENPNNRLNANIQTMYVHSINDDLHETMKILFAACKNKNTLKSLSKFIYLADTVPFDFGLFCFHSLVINGFTDTEIQLSLPKQLYDIEEFQSLRFLDRLLCVLRFNLFSSINSLKIPNNVQKAFQNA